MMAQPAYILLDDQLTHQQRFYTNPINVITAHTPKDLPAAFAKLIAYQKQGLHLAGYLSYELGLTFEPKLAPLLRDNLQTPLLHFGIFKSVSSHAPTHYLYKADTPELTLKPRWTESQYQERFDKVMGYIRAGDVYQINLTFPMTAEFKGEAHALYAAYRHRQKGRYGGIVSLGNTPDIISLSPELFFRKEAKNISMRPMKGTRPRGTDTVLDDTLRQDMRGDAKSQAENLMIVDLLRNDLSRISKPGSVKVPELFALETYPTLHQMTSRVLATLNDDIDIETILRNLFPCGSVTGAPKIRAMEIIDELEDTPRGAYCGALGYIDPNGRACFNVGIRTITLQNNKLTYNVGSGLVLDSKATNEYQECLLKADVLTVEPTNIIETFRWNPKDGFIRGKRHKARMKKAARALGYPFRSAKYDKALKPVESKDKPQHVRLTLNAKGVFTLTFKDYSPLNTAKIILSRHKLSQDVQMSKHKISQRNFYDGERARLQSLSGADEVIFLNEKNEVCEGSFTSIFIKKDGDLFTPPLCTGILPGILRAELIENSQAHEANISADELQSADKLYIGNSLRGLMMATLLKPKKT